MIDQMTNTRLNTRDVFTRYRNIAALAVIGMFLTACDGQSMNSDLADRSNYLEPAPKNEVTATPLTHTVSLDPGQNALSSRQNVDMSLFLEQVGRDRGDHYEIRTSYVTGSGNSKIATDLRNSFISQGVMADRIQLVHMASYEQQLELVVRRYTVISPNCPVEEVRFGDSNRNEPVRTRKLGCSNEYNLGRMVADPRDLVGGRPIQSANGEMNSGAVERYRARETEDLRTQDSLTIGGSD